MSHHLIHSPVFNINGTLFTSTMEIAEATYVQHKNVLELVHKYVQQLTELGIEGVAFKTQAFETAGGPQQREVAYLTEQQATFLMSLMRNTEIVVAFKRRLVQAFYEMRFRERANRPADMLADPAALRSMLLGYTEKVLALEQTVAEQQPKVAALEAIAAAPQHYCMRDAAKHLGWKPSELVSWLQQEHWIFRNYAAERWVAYQTMIDTGLLVHKIVTIGEAEDGQPRTVPQVVVTSKGLARIALLFEKRRQGIAATAVCGTQAHA